MHRYLCINSNLEGSSSIYCIRMLAKLLGDSKRDYIVKAWLPVANQSYDNLADKPKVTPVIIPKICYILEHD